MSKFGYLAGLFLVCGLFQSPARADLYGAQQAYKKQDFTQAFTLYRELAELGHAAAQETVAVMYVTGEGVKRDNVLGYGWALIARENGGGDGMQSIISQIEPHLTDSARKRVADLQAQFGKAALQKSLLPVLPEPGSKQEFKADPNDCTFKRPANPDDFYPLAAVQQGISGNVELEYTVMPDGRAHNPRVIIGLPPGAFDQPAKNVLFNSVFKPKTVNGVAVPCTVRVRVRFTVKGGTAGSQNPQLVKALDDARKGALAGDPISQMTYALLLQGLATAGTTENPVVWHTRAAQAGLSTAQYMVGSFLMATTSASFDERKGLIWLNKAADAGQADAQVDLANYLLKKTGDPASRARAFELLDRAAATDSLEAKYRFASLLASDADESRRDPRRALKLLDQVMIGKEIDPTAFEIRAAANAMLGDFKTAQSDQERAIRLAAKYGWDLAPQKALLEKYQNNAAWTGDLLGL